MLVLSRKEKEQIVIGDDVVITVVDVRGDKVRLGVDAPDGVPVHRSEIYNKIKPSLDLALVPIPELSKLGLSQRTINTLERGGFNYASELVNEDNILGQCENAGPGMIAEIKACLTRIRDGEEPDENDAASVALPLRLSKEDMEEIRRKAADDGQTLQVWCLEKLRAA